MVFSVRVQLSGPANNATFIYGEQDRNGKVSLNCFFLLHSVYRWEEKRQKNNDKSLVRRHVQVRKMLSFFTCRMVVCHNLDDFFYKRMTP